MPPVNPEQNYSPEQQNNQERYMDIERTDVDLRQFGRGQAQNVPVQQQQQPISPRPQQTKQVDPVEIFKNMISAGFTPTRAQLASVSSQSVGPDDSSNTWLKLLLQRLIRQERKRKQRTNGRN